MWNATPCWLAILCECEGSVYRSKLTWSSCVSIVISLRGNRSLFMFTHLCSCLHAYKNNKGNSLVSQVFERWSQGKLPGAECMHHTYWGGGWFALNFCILALKSMVWRWEKSVCNAWVTLPFGLKSGGIFRTDGSGSSRICDTIVTCGALFIEWLLFRQTGHHHGSEWRVGGHWWRWCRCSFRSCLRLHQDGPVPS